jgi:hypothetical protein
VQRGEQPQCLADPQLVGQGSVLQLGADAAAQAVAGRRRVEAEDLRRAAVRPTQALEDLDGGRLSGAVGAEQAEQLATADGEGHAVEDVGRPVALAQPIDFDDVRCHGSIVNDESRARIGPQTIPRLRPWEENAQRRGSTSR